LRLADASPRACAQRATDRRARRWRGGAAACSGLLLALAFPPFDLGALVLLALAPLFWAWRGASSREGAIYGGLFGVVFFAIVLDWARYFGAIAIVPLVLVSALFPAAAGAVLGCYRRRGVWSPFLVAAVWVVLEGLRDRGPLGGLPFGDLGLALHDASWARALAAWGGVALVTFVVAFVNAALVEIGISVVARGRDGVDAGRHLPASLLALGLVVAAVAAAVALRPTTEVTGRIRYALLQGNDQNRDLTQREVDHDYLTRRHLALADTLRGHYDLVVFPESALEGDPTRDGDLRADITSVGRRHGAVVVANAQTRSRAGGILNANLVYNPNGTLQGRYAKQHLVPFGEYVPLRGLLGFVGALDQVPFDFERGSGRRLFTAGGHRFETVICYESAFAPLVRNSVRDGAEFVVVSTNNRSYRRSGLSAQHVAMSQMRAAETGRPILHASISGITAAVDADGRVLDRSELFVNRVTAGTIETRTGSTPFLRFGDWVLLGCLLGLVGAAVVQRRGSAEARP
jgi:apolipoprotein N-acyltransferase